MKSRKRRALGFRLVAALMTLAMAVPSQAAPRKRTGVPIVRDAEIEALVASYAAPILKAAGLSRSGIEIVLVNSPDFNAFVSGRRIFMNTGTILNTTTPNEVTGILAHEIGHLAGGHQQRLREQMEQAKTLALITGVLGAGVAVAGAASGSRGAAGAGSGMMMGGGAVAQRGLMSYQRGEESTADRAALTYLEKAKLSGRGLIRTFETLERNSVFSRGGGRSYLSSHPVPRERIASLQTAAAESPYYGVTDSADAIERHDFARAKIVAYGEGASAVRRTFARSPRSLPALYGDAIATHLEGSSEAALRKIDALIAQRPTNPWFHEIRGEILMEAGRGEQAAAAYLKAQKLDKTGSGILKAEVGQALVVGGTKKDLAGAIESLEAGLRADPANGQAYRFLAMAYERTGDVGRAELATAEGYWQSGALRDAKIFAARAQGKLKPGTPAWQRAADILKSKG
ncbi:M48 family metalloprotease [Aurantimonas sp. Leaf443]|uniref:M48 family metalloprotease n=1 Tax=Aurantimonas sp. Leaf443 TaxID=1736378 RepID=UPI0006FB3FE1|nr:M48 family metalloprotease [Aurantimonas sp. Leaf443]KQT83424.1 peptidase [Aurantimonas sp. Leaf443]